jgi:hypothetical protein
MKSRVTTAIAAALFALAVAGCGDSGNDTGNGDAGTGGNEGGGGDAVAWAESVCSNIKDDIEAISTQPEVDQTNPQAAKDSLVGYLGTLETSLDGMASAVEDAGTPPVDGGEEAVTGFTDEVGTAKEAVTSAKTKIEAAPVNDAAAFQGAVVSAMEDLQALSEIDPTGSFSDNEELNKAYDEAAACKEIEQATS